MEEGSSSSSEQRLLERILDGKEKPADLQLALLQKITGNFSKERKIGHGGSGAVYKGVLGEQNVAVKRIYVNLERIDDDDKQFGREFTSLCKTSHPNIVRFLGFCSNIHQKWIPKDGSGEMILANVRERLFCFEYISSGSLDKHITDELRGFEWETRYEIIMGICKGLHYLHEEKEIIHMDLKPENILLDHQDEKYIPKITDFGLSRPNEKSYTMGKVYGTRGYCAPEYSESSKTTPACDIYSLGAIIRQLVTGSMEIPNKDNALRRWRHRWRKPPSLLQYQQVTRCIELAGSCRKPKPKDRPSIKQIIDLLTESTDRHTGQVSPCLAEDDMLRINPLELRVPSKIKNKISCSVQLTNDTCKCIAFNIQPLSARYSAQPNKGIVRPESEYSVKITVHAGDVQGHGHAKKFIVQSMQVEASEGLRDEDIKDCMFEKTSKFVDKVDLIVVYDPAKSLKRSRSKEDTNMPAEKVPKTFRQHPSPMTMSTTCRSPHAGLPAGTCSTHEISTPESMNALLSTTLWVVGKALAPVADGVLGHWVASKNQGLNVEALSGELLQVEATLEIARHKHIDGQAMEKLLCKLQDSAHCAQDFLDELDYFRIHDNLAAYKHATPGAEPGQVLGDARQQPGWSPRNSPSSSTPSDNQAEEEEVNGYMTNLGKLLPFSSSSNVHDVSSDGQSTLSHLPQMFMMLGFDGVAISERMKRTVYQLQLAHTAFAEPLRNCDRITYTVPKNAQSRPVTISRSIEQKLYGRDNIMNSIIYDMTKDKYHNNDLSVLPIVGPGGIGKTTMIQHIYHNEEVQKHFHVVIWVCVSLKFNLNKLLEEIKTYIPHVDGERGNRPEELIEQRLKSKRFLLVLDDIWECSNEDDWKRLLQPLKASKEKGNMVLITTRFPAIAKMVGAADHSIELEGLEAKYFKELFHAFVFDDDQCRRDNSFLLETGDKIMVNLKGSPLAAKTVGRLLRKDLRLRHWKNVLESKRWESQNDANDIMPALKLSYDYLPFPQQQCFSYSALFPEDHKYSSTELINLWIGLDILQPNGQNKSPKEIGLSNLNGLVTHGFFREVESVNGSHYVMHDLLHDLALKVASHDCVSLQHSNVGSVEIQPSIRHISIIIDGDDPESHGNFKSQLTKLKTRLKVKQLHTLMLFGKMQENFASVLVDMFSEANALRVLHLANMQSYVESMLHNFSELVHLRYLFLGTTKNARQMQLPLPISRFYHLRILDLGSWYGDFVIPKDFINLAKLCHFYTPVDELHSYILNVGKLILLEELKVFRFNKESEGFEPEQLEHLTELRELGIYNLENIHTREEASKAKLIEKSFLERLTLDWDSKRSNIEPDVEVVVLESLQPHRYLEELCIRGHGGPSCPTWLGDKLVVEALQSLHLDGVSWQCIPYLGRMWGLEKLILKHIATMKEFVIEQSFCRLTRLELVGLRSFEKWIPSEDACMFPLLQVLTIKDCPKLFELPFSNPNQDWNIDWFPKLQELVIKRCPKFLLVARIPWTETLRQVDISDVKLLEKFEYNSKSSDMYISGKDDLQSLDQVLVFNNLSGLQELKLKKCPPLELKQLLMLTSLKKLVVESSDGPLIEPLGADDDVERHLPIEYLEVMNLDGVSGKDLTVLLTHLPRLSRLDIKYCKYITQLSVAVDVQQQTALEKNITQLVLPAHLSDSLQHLRIFACPELVLVEPSSFRVLRSLQILRIEYSRKVLSICPFSCCPFPSSLQELHLSFVEGMGTLEPLSRLTSLTRLDLRYCGKELRCKDLGPLLTAGGQLRELSVRGSPKFFAGWDPNPRRLQPFYCPLQKLTTDDVVGLLATPVCTFLSSSLTHLHLYGLSQEVECFSKEQEDALHLLASLQQLHFSRFKKLQHLPAGMHKLTNLKQLEVYKCPAVRSLPKDGLPKSLQLLVVDRELKQQCRGLVGTIQTIYY